MSCCIQTPDSQTFDAVLVAAYGLHAYLSDGHQLHPPTRFNNVCTNPDIEPWADGQKLINYIKQVSLSTHHNDLFVADPLDFGVCGLDVLKEFTIKKNIHPDFVPKPHGKHFSTIRFWNGDYPKMSSIFKNKTQQFSKPHKYIMLKPLVIVNHIYGS